MPPANSDDIFTQRELIDYANSLANQRVDDIGAAYFLSDDWKSPCMFRLTGIIVGIGTRDDNFTYKHPHLLIKCSDDVIRAYLWDGLKESIRSKAAVIVKDNRYPHTCIKCGQPAYLNGMNMFEHKNGKFVCEDKEDITQKIVI